MAVPHSAGKPTVHHWVTAPRLTAKQLRTVRDLEHDVGRKVQRPTHEFAWGREQPVCVRGGQTSACERDGAGKLHVHQRMSHEQAYTVPPPADAHAAIAAWMALVLIDLPSPTAPYLVTSHT